MLYCELEMSTGQNFSARPGSLDIFFGPARLSKMNFRFQKLPFKIIILQRKSCKNYLKFNENIINNIEISMKIQMLISLLSKTLKFINFK